MVHKASAGLTGAVAIFLMTVTSAIALGPPRAKTFDAPPRTEWKPDGCRTVPGTVLASRDQWRFLHSDSAASDEVSIAIAPTFEPDWHTEDATFNVAVPTFDHDGNLYFSPLWPHENVVLISIDPSDGSRRWAIAGTGAPPGGVAPIVLDDPDNSGAEIVYQTFYDRALAVKTDGTIVWDVPTGLTLTGIGRQDAVLGNNYHPQVDAIVGLSGDGHIYALDRATGVPLFASPYSLPGEPSPAGSGLSLPPGVVDAVEDELSQFLNFPPSVTFEGFLEVILGNGIEVANSFAIDANSGRLWIAATAPDADDGDVDGVSELGALYELDLVPNGMVYDVSTACYATFAGGSATTPGLQADGSRGYIGDNFGNLVAIDDGTCDVAWTLPMGSQIVGSVAVASDNLELYVATQSDVVQVIDGGASASVGWTASLDVTDPGQTNQDDFNMLLAGIGANGVSFMAAGGIPPGVLANIGLPMTVGYGLLDRETGAIRYFTEGLDESVAEMNVGPDGGYYNANSPIRRAFTKAIYPNLSTAPLEGGIRKFKPTHIDLLIRDIACAAYDRAVNAAANEATCPASAAADVVQIEELIEQASRMEATAVAGGDLSTAKRDVIDAQMTLAVGAPLATAAAALERACKVIAPCPPSPATGCRTAGTSKLTLSRDPDKIPNADKLVWSWLQGEPTDIGELGTPNGTTDYGACVYAGATETLVYESGVPASALWKTSAKGIGYNDKLLSERGIKTLRIKASDEQKATAKVSAKGAELPAGPFPLDAPVVVQVLNGETGLCWESRFDAGDVTKSHAFQYKAKTQ